jgi:hypothetical protein
LKCSKSWIKGLGEAVKANRRDYTGKGLHIGNEKVMKGSFRLDMCNL